MMQPRTFLFGLIRVEAWGWRWGYTAAQIELMAADRPIVVYTNGKPPKPTAKALNAAAEKWEKKYGHGEKVDLSAILNSDRKWQS